jgi:outer membrane protein TolC
MFAQHPVPAMNGPRGIVLKLLFCALVWLFGGCQHCCQHALRRAACAVRTPLVAEQPTNDVRNAPAARELPIRLASLETTAPSEETAVIVPEHLSLHQAADSASGQAALAELELLATQHNPALRRIKQEAQAAWEKARYADKLPDPSIGANFFIPPMNFEPERQVGDVQLMQMIPWLGRLKAQARRACLEALVAENVYQSERLQVLADVRASWYRLYVANRHLQTLQTEKVQLESLIETTSNRVSTGAAQPGDVLLATLELSALQEQFIGLRRQAVAATVELNRLLGRDPETPIPPPGSISAALPARDLAQLRKMAHTFQPELNAARLRTAATRWGIEVARLKRRPDLTLGVGWVVMDAPGAMTPHAGRDSLTLGVSATLPIGRTKYDAITSEAMREHLAAHASEDEVATKVNAALHDLWDQALARQQILELQKTSSLPQARQTFEADLNSLATGAVTFERVIQDLRALLKLEMGYHEALGGLAMTIARIRQVTGEDLAAVDEGRQTQPRGAP